MCKFFYFTPTIPPIIDDIINDIEEKAEIVEVEDTDKTETVEQVEEPPADNPYWAYIKMKLIDVDFTELKQVNTDTVGWISVNGTNINYPFVQSNDNKFYLNHSFDKTYNDAGWVFLDYRNNFDLSKNNILYAHARADKTMFGSLHNTLKDEWLNNKDNHVIKISTVKENSLWQIFSIYSLETESYYITTHFKNDDEFSQYIIKSLERSRYNFNVNLDKDDTILTLSTCHGENKKFVVQAKLIKKEIKNP